LEWQLATKKERGKKEEWVMDHGEALLIKKV
jgi:hypothetical protein